MSLKKISGENFFRSQAGSPYYLINLNCNNISRI